MAYNRRIVILRMDRWYDTTVRDTLRMKRISIEREKQFPRKYRIMLRDYSPSYVVQRLREEHDLGFKEAWDMLKQMVNTIPLGRKQS